jgi:hypothetical protein
MVRIWDEALYYQTPEAFNEAKAHGSRALLCSNMYSICTFNTQVSCTISCAT